MAEELTLYRRWPRPPSRAMTSTELMEGIHYTIASDESDSSQCPEGEWYCDNQNCVVRQVTVSCKLFGEPLPTMKCPACRSRMKFNHWLRSESLVPYKGEGESE